jgi:hypothetical protein
VQDSTTLTRLMEHPAPVFEHLLGQHLDRLLAGWPGGAALRPASIPAAAIWAGAVVNNLWYAAAYPDGRLLDCTLRLARALPTADTRPAALAYHSLLRVLDSLTPAREWQPVVRLLLERSPFTAAWLPRIAEPYDWSLLLRLLEPHPLRAALRDRVLSLLPSPDMLRDSLDTDTARANAEAGRLLTGLLEHGGAAWQPFVLACYEADCLIQRRGSDERPIWPLLERLRGLRSSDDTLQRRNAGRILARYRALVALREAGAPLSRYLYLDGRFVQQLAHLLPSAAARLHLRPVSAAGEP